jgi:hypothetical protein
MGWLVQERRDPAGTTGAAETTGATGAAPEALWPLGPGVTLVGSDSGEVGAGLVIHDADLEPVHAFLFHREGQIWFLDLGSTAGSWVNDQRLPPFTGRELRDRDLLRLGSFSLRFRALSRTEPG